MTSGTGSISLSGLLGGVAGQIDTTSLIASLMQAEAIPQQQLKNQLSVQQAMLQAYQAINTRATALQTAAQAVTDPTAWTATAATSSSGTVVASSDGTAAVGSTTFDVLQLAQAQVSTVAANSSGVVVSNPSAGIVITDSTGTQHAISLTSGAATDVATAINQAKVGVQAVVVNTTSGQVLQLSSSTTGAAAAFTSSGFDTPATTIVNAQDAQIGVGNPAAGGYTVASATNTFTNAIPGVTFTVSAVTSGVTISVGSDENGISNKVSALVDAANAASREVTIDSSAGGILQGRFDVSSLVTDIGSSVSQGANGASLKTYGIDIDKNGVISFDAAAFSAAYSKDPAGTQNAVGNFFASSLATTAGNAIAPVTGTVTNDIADATSQSDSLTKQIDAWTSRLSDIQAQLQSKYTAMQTALAKLQSQSTYLTNMLKSMNSGSSSSSSSTG